MIPFETVCAFLSEYGQIYVKGLEIQLRCPLCGDSRKSKLKKRFSVRYENGCSFFHCFNCGESGSFIELVAKLKGISIQEAFRLVDIPDFEHIKKELSKKTNVTPKKKIIDTIQNSILDDCINDTQDVQGYVLPRYQKRLQQFISDRNIPKEYSVFIAYKGSYKGRIIIPIFKGNDIVYFQGRSLDKESDLRFMNPEVEKSNIIMNVDFFKKDEFIIVTEGIIDAMSVEYNQGTCVIGGSISDDFLFELYKHTNKGIVIAVDNDARGKKERDKLMNESVYGKQLFYFIPPNPYKDLNEYKIKGSVQNMYDTISEQCVDYWTFSIRQKI